MTLKSRTPHHADAYSPSSEAERNAELADRNSRRLVEYYDCRVRQRENQLRTAYVERHAAPHYRGPVRA